MGEQVVLIAFVVLAIVLVALGLDWLVRSWRGRLHDGLDPDEFERRLRHRQAVLDRMLGLEDDDNDA